MRTLQFRNPYRVDRTMIYTDFKEDHTPGYNYARQCSVVTKFGIVLVSELKWEYNNGKDNFTFFSTVRGGYRYSAMLNEAQLSDRQMKWLSTHFIKKVIALERTEKKPKGPEAKSPS